MGRGRSPEDLGHVSCDGLLTERPGGRHAVMAVGDVVVAVQPVDLDGWKLSSLTQRHGNGLEAPAAPPVGREEVAVELAVGAVCGADDVPQKDLLFFRVARPAQPQKGRLLQGGQVEPVWLPMQRRRDAMALVLSACLVEGVLGVQPGTGQLGRGTVGSGQVGDPRARTRQPGSRIPRHRSAGSAPWPTVGSRTS
jgi:hypothetical protein